MLITKEEKQQEIIENYSNEFGVLEQPIEFDEFGNLK